MLETGLARTSTEVDQPWAHNQSICIKGAIGLKAGRCCAETADSTVGNEHIHALIDAVCWIDQLTVDDANPHSVLTVRLLDENPG